MKSEKKKRRRPDKERIVTHLLETQGLAMAATLEVLDMMINEKKIINIKTTKGEDSFYEAESYVIPENEIGNKGNKKPSQKISATMSGDETTPRVLNDGLHNPGKLILYPPEPNQNFVNELASALGRMAETVNVLNTLLQDERSKTSALLLENFGLK